MSSYSDDYGFKQWCVFVIVIITIMLSTIILSAITQSIRTQSTTVKHHQDIYQSLKDRNK